MKTLLKKLIGKLQCYRFGIKQHGNNVYIGIRTKIIGGQYIYLGNNVQIRHDCFLSCNKNAKLTIGDGADIGERSRICCAAEIKIGPNVLTGPNVFITDHDHAYTNTKNSIKDQGTINRKTVQIDDDCFIGTNSVIIGGSIGKHTVVGSNSVVTKEFSEFCVIAGNPAKTIRKFDLSKNEWIRVNDSRNFSNDKQQ